jgi:uncharacterized protein (DUF1697 family)
MPRFITFLRAINVGGHNVKMEHLRQLFESLGFSSVETFIASGNVVFSTRSRNAKALERKIENRLRETLGYEVTTFIRTEEELAAIANYNPFSQADLDSAVALYIGFLPDTLDDKFKQKLMALRTDTDYLHVHEREIYWLSRMGQSESTISNSLFEKTLGSRSTFRSANTVRKMASKYSSPLPKARSAR